MNRRRFLLLGALGVAAGAAGSRSEPLRCAPRELLDLLGPESVRRLGRRYRAMVPAEDFLSEALWRQPIAHRVRDDFARRRTVVVMGWMLSATEARQCALFSLLPA